MRFIYLLVPAITLVAACPDDTKNNVDDDGDGYTIDDGDCDDLDSDVHPDGDEVCDDGIDNDCDGGDAVCITDLDGDGYSPEDGDCNDGNDDIHPDAAEDCNNNDDDDCNGIITTCPFPTLIYTPIGQGISDSYGVAVFSNRIMFGDPAGVANGQIADGRVVLFDLSPDGYVTENDAEAISGGEVGADGAFGIVMNLVGGMVCPSADYHDFDLTQHDAGKSWCFSSADVSAAAGVGPALASADVTIAGEEGDGFATADAEVDADGDGLRDLLVYTAQGIHVIAGSGAPWAGNYQVPSQAAVTIPCASSSIWCGFARAYSGSAVAMSLAGGPADEVSIYALPLGPAPLAPAATYPISRGSGDSAVALPEAAVFAFGSSTDDRVHFFDYDGNAAESLFGPDLQGFGGWVDVMTDQQSHELLLVGAPYADGNRGALYVFDLTAHGLPRTEADAIHILVADENQSQCGFRGRGGVISDADGTHTTIAISCPGSGGAAFVIDSRPPPAPLVKPPDVHPTGEPGHIQIRRWVINAFTSRADWALTLAGTEAVFNPAHAIVGWRLHGITTGSPLHLAGLRTGDIVNRVGNFPLTTPASVRQAVHALSNSNLTTLRFIRAGVTRQLTYHVVP